MVQEEVSSSYVEGCIVQGVPEANKAYASAQKQETPTVPPSPTGFLQGIL